MLLHIEAVWDVAAARAPDLGALTPAETVNIIHMRPPHPGEGVAGLDGACTATGAGGSCTGGAVAAPVAAEAIGWPVDEGTGCMPEAQCVAVQQGRREEAGGRRPSASQSASAACRGGVFHVCYRLRMCASSCKRSCDGAPVDTKKLV